MAITGIFNSHLMLALAVEKFGTEPQKRALAAASSPRGEIRGGLALTEPDAGTDLQAIRMTARRDGDDYVINGTKTWISNGIEGSCFALLVKTDPEAEPRHTRHEPVHRAQGAGLHASAASSRSSATSAIDSARADLRGLPHPGRPPDRRGRGPRLHPGGGRARARPHQRRGARRRHRRGRAASSRPATRSCARPSASRSASTRRSSSSSARWPRAPAPRAC